MWFANSLGNLNQLLGIKKYGLIEVKLIATGFCDFLHLFNKVMPLKFGVCKLLDISLGVLLGVQEMF